MKKQVINHWAVWLSVIIAQLVPAAYYWFFGREWMRLNDITQQQIDNQDIGPYVIGFIASIVTMYVLAWLFQRLEVDSAREGIILGLVLAIAFNAVHFLTIYMFSFRGIELAVLDAGVNLLVYGIAGLILGAWRKFEEAPAV